MAHTQTIDLLANTSFLTGRAIRAFYSSGGAALLLEDGEVVEFGVEAILIVGWFEVVPITAERRASDVYPWDIPFVIDVVCDEHAMAGLLQDHLLE